MFDATAPCNSTTSVMPVLGGSLSMVATPMSLVNVSMILFGISLIF
jgi:hypothetical protein